MSDPHEITAISHETPATVTRYSILKELGTGGMGSVYLAEDRKLPRYVAIKTIRKELCQNQEIRRRIERECQLHAKIGTHPHIVTLYDQLEEGDQISLVMEYVPGLSLAELQQQAIQQESILPWRQSVEIVCQLLDALGRIHGHGIVHRDVKPSNILLARDDAGNYWVKLMDFGIARPELNESTALTHTGGSLGTPLYMAPEQIDPNAFGGISPATDIYAVGVVLYQLLAGKPPFEGTMTAVMIGHVTREPPPIKVPKAGELPPGLQEVLLRALNKKPQERFASARSFRESLEQVAQAISDTGTGKSLAAETQFNSAQTLLNSQGKEPVFSRGATQLSVPRPVRRRKGVMAGSVLLAVVVALGGGYWVMRNVGLLAPPKEPVASAGNASESGSVTTDVANTSDKGNSRQASSGEKTSGTSIKSTVQTPATTPQVEVSSAVSSPSSSEVDSSEVDTLQVRATADPSSAPAMTTFVDMDSPRIPANAQQEIPQDSALDLLKQLRPDEGKAEQQDQEVIPSEAEQPSKESDVQTAIIKKPEEPAVPKVITPKKRVLKKEPPPPKKSSTRQSGGWSNVIIHRDETHRKY